MGLGDTLGVLPPENGGTGKTDLSGLASDVLAKAYPVGSFFFSTAATNPGTLLGFGTWEQVRDTFLLACGTKYGAGSKGGEASHTLTVDEMPSHSHEFSLMISNGSSNVWPASGLGSIVATTSTKAAGGGQAHNNMPPYWAVYVWHRTA